LGGVIFFSLDRTALHPSTPVFNLKAYNRAALVPFTLKMTTAMYAETFGELEKHGTVKPQNKFQYCGVSS
jgi:hypothetical protein